MGLVENIKIVEDKIARAAEKAGVNPDGIELVAVSKTVNTDVVKEAYDAGLRTFGENRVQELLKKE